MFVFFVSLFLRSSSVHRTPLQRRKVSIRNIRTLQTLWIISFRCRWQIAHSLELKVMWSNHGQTLRYFWCSHYKLPKVVPTSDRNMWILPNTKYSFGNPYFVGQVSVISMGLLSVLALLCCFLQNLLIGVLFEEHLVSVSGTLRTLYRSHLSPWLLLRTHLVYCSLEEVIAHAPSSSLLLLGRLWLAPRCPRR